MAGLNKDTPTPTDIKLHGVGANRFDMIDLDTLFADLQHFLPRSVAAYFG